MNLKFLKLLSVTLAVALGLGGFASTAQATKDVKIALYSPVTTTDPWDANDTISQGVAKSFYEGLYSFDQDMKLRPTLAESYEVTPDGLVYTFKLRSGVKFHDGTDFNAEAVKVNFDRVTNPDNRLKRYNLYSNIEKTEVLDPLTVRFTLKKPFSPFVNQIAHPSAVMISPAALEKYGKDIRFHPVGTGPFIFDEWRQTDYLRVKKNPNYWRAGLPKVDSISWLPIVESASRVAMIRTGEAHFAISIPFEQAEVLEKTPGVKLTPVPSIVQRFVSMNVQHKPLSDVRVRQAINYAINKDALVKVVYRGYGTPAEGVVPEGVEYAVKFGAWPYDPKKAKALLAEAGYPNGFETQLWAAYNDTVSQKAIQFMQQQLQQVGIKATVQAMEAGQRVEQVESAPDPAKAPVRMYYVGWSSSTGEADWALRPLLHGDYSPPKSYNMAYYNDPAVNAGMEKALITTDKAEKAKIYKEVQEKIWNDAPWVFAITAKNLVAQSDKLSGMHQMPDASYFFEEIDLKQ